MYTFQELKLARMHMWIDQIKQNLLKIESSLTHENYHVIIPQLREQYRLIRLLRNTMSGKTKLEGWKTKSTDNNSQ